MEPYPEMMPRLHVLLVDHEEEGRVSTIRKLQSQSYMVTTVDSHADALSMILEEEVKFDVVMAFIKVPDMDMYDLLQIAIENDIRLIFTSDEEEEYYAYAEIAVDEGVFLFITKPVSEEILKMVWQLIYREKYVKTRARNLENLVPATMPATPDRAESVIIEKDEKEYSG